MKKVLDNYFTAHFKNLNDLTEKGYEKSAKYYKNFYSKFLSEDKNIKILDVGCGTGQFLYFLQKEGYRNFFGIDISGQQIEYCREKISKNVEEADIMNYVQGKENMYDLIVLNDVLEHIEKNRLTDVLDKIFAALHVNGQVFIKVPNCANPFGLVDRYKDITHEIGFTEYSLLAVLSATGFTEVNLCGRSYLAMSFLTVNAKIMEKIFHACLKIMFMIQGYRAPKILNRTLIAVGKKK